MLSVTLGLVVLCAVGLSPSKADGIVYHKTNSCETQDENLYKYYANEEYFGDNYTQTFDITLNFTVHCISRGNYGTSNATLFALNVEGSQMGGNILARTNDPEATSADFSGWFQFVRTDDGTIPVTLYSREEDATIVNIKKSLVSAFQTDFDLNGTKVEADPQSQHKSEYSYFASVQDKKNGVMRYQRLINSKLVIGFAQHIPREEVKLEKVEVLEFKIYLLTRASGTIRCKLMTEVNVNSQTDTQSDSLENERQQSISKRETTNTSNETLSYDESLTTNYYESTGQYKVELVNTRRLLRHRRSVEAFNFPDVEISSLLGSINQTRKAIAKMHELRTSIGDVVDALEILHDNPEKTEIAHKLEKLVKLEAEFGPTPSFSPTIDDVLEYLITIAGSNSTRDIRMRYKIYFIICSDGTLSSQMALLESFEKAVNDDEVDTIIMYLSAVVNPQPRFVAKLERLISSDVHSDSPLLLAYGALLPRSSVELQQRMFMFLHDRVPLAEQNKTSLIHHILSLGNTGSCNMSSVLAKYLAHSEVDVQLTAILAMRFIMEEDEIQKSLKELITRSNATEDHVKMVIKSLLYGTEHAKVNHEKIPYPCDLLDVLVKSAIKLQNNECLSALKVYLTQFNTSLSVSLLNEIQTARFRRDSTSKVWDDTSNGEFDLIEPSATRSTDAKTFIHQRSFMWGKKFGGKDINVQVAAGAFAGVSDAGSYKLFGHAVAKATCYDYTLTMLEFLVLRQKDEKSTESQLLAVVMGKTVKSVRETQDSSVCKTIDKPVYEAKDYTIFDFTYSVFVVVGTLNFHLTATAKFTTGLYVEFCDNLGRATAGAGLSPTLTLTVAASGDLEVVWVAKAGLTLSATFNYQLLPEVTTEFCYKNGKINIKNCIGIYHQWTDNAIDLYAWYAWRGKCGWFVCTGKDAYKHKHKIDKLSFEWRLPSSGKKKLLQKCDNNLPC